MSWQGETLANLLLYILPAVNEAKNPFSLLEPSD